MSSTKPSVTISVQEFRAGVLTALPAQLGMIPWGIAFGLLASKLAMTGPQALGMSALVFSGTAQMVILEFWRSPFAWATVLFAVFAINSRYILQGATLSPWLGQTTRFHRAMLLWTMVDISWAMSLERFKAASEKGQPADLGFMYGAQAACAFTWVATTAIGVYMPLQRLDMQRWGFDMAVSAMLIAILAGGFKFQWVKLTWLAALGVAWWARDMLGGNWYVLIGGVVGALLAAALPNVLSRRASGSI